MELAATGEDLMALREIAKVHIAKCKEGDMSASFVNYLNGRHANDPATGRRGGGDDEQTPAEHKRSAGKHR